jgi:hypothetical protein
VLTGQGLTTCVRVDEVLVESDVLPP